MMWIRFGWFYGPRWPGFLCPWLKAAFIFLLVGYGGKMGLAPLHNWLPDAHSEAPSLSFGAALRRSLGRPRCDWAATDFAGRRNWRFQLLAARVFGLVSLVIAALLKLLAAGALQKNAGPIPAWEHMGTLALGIGVGAASPSRARFCIHSAFLAINACCSCFPAIFLPAIHLFEL